MKINKSVARASQIGAVAVVGALLLSACGGGDSQTSTGEGTCSVEPVKVVATTNVWGNISNQLAGPCASVTTAITSAAADPHDFEPDTSVSASYSQAKLIIENGAGYDEWSDKIIASLGADAPKVLDLAKTVGVKTGENPHIWYSPTYVQESAAAITKSLREALPEEAASFDDAAKKFKKAQEPYLAEVENIKKNFAGSKVNVTESVFDYMLQATEIKNITPTTFADPEPDDHAADDHAGESHAADDHEDEKGAHDHDAEPSVQSIAQFRKQLENKLVQAMIYNSQTDGGVPSQLKQVAEQSGVPVVSITETLTPEGATFQEWQIGQLQQLAKALGPN